MPPSLFKSLHSSPRLALSPAVPRRPGTSQQVTSRHGKSRRGAALGVGMLQRARGSGSRPAQAGAIVEREASWQAGAGSGSSGKPGTAHPAGCVAVGSVGLGYPEDGWQGRGRAGAASGAKKCLRGGAYCLEVELRCRCCCAPPTFPFGSCLGRSPECHDLPSPAGSWLPFARCLLQTCSPCASCLPTSR
jgi:hypothetical protein